MTHHNHYRKRSGHLTFQRTDSNGPGALVATVFSPTAGELRKIKNFWATCVVSPSAVTSPARMAGTLALVRYPEKETFAATDYIEEDPRTWSLTPFVVGGGTSYYFTFKGPDFDVKPSDKVYLVANFKLGGANLYLNVSYRWVERREISLITS